VRIVIQRVKEASVTADDQVIGAIGKGALVFFAVQKGDSSVKTLWLAQKLTHLRMFSDHEGKMNLSLKDIKGEVLIVSQFTLYGNCIEGRRPDFIEAASPDVARPIYEKFVQEVKKDIEKVQTGRFGAYMEISLINDGPVTFIIDTKS
jgi:D-aminoacyl-tRNA deacylase